jgi:hypothetical protein
MTITEDRAIVPETPDEVHEYGRMVWERATSPVWPRSARITGENQAGALLDALEEFESIRDEITHPAAWYDDLAGEPEAKYAALVMTAQAITDLTAELVRVFPGSAVTAENSDEEGAAA